MDIVWEYLTDLQSRHSAYAIAALLVLVWWVGRSFVRLYRQATSGAGRLERPQEEERPRRRLPLD
jgi:hypothetical protein